jgi:hypothetical protein
MDRNQRIAKEDSLGKSKGYRPISAALSKYDPTSMSPVRIQTRQN